MILAPEGRVAAFVCATLCGARGYLAIVQWLHALPCPGHRLGFTRRPPKDHAFRDLLAALSPEAFEAALRQWMTTLLGTQLSDDRLRMVAVVGKSLCGTFTQHQRAGHLLSHFDQELGGVLSQQRVDEKTNEHKAELELLKTVVLRNCTVRDRLTPVIFRLLFQHSNARA